MSFFPGSFLIARQTLRDPSFASTVVLLLQHNEDGALGLVLNRPLKAEGLPFQVFSGGPCQTPGLFMLHGRPDWSDDSRVEVAPGIFVGDQQCLERASDLPPEEVSACRVFLGYAGWGPGQLESEIAAGAWAMTQAAANVLFETPTEDLWSRLCPPAIPQPSLN